MTAIKVAFPYSGAPLTFPEDLESLTLKDHGRTIGHAVSVKPTDTGYEVEFELEGDEVSGIFYSRAELNLVNVIAAPDMLSFKSATIPFEAQ